MDLLSCKSSPHIFLIRHKGSSDGRLGRTLISPILKVLTALVILTPIGALRFSFLSNISCVLASNTVRKAWDSGSLCNLVKCCSPNFVRRISRDGSLASASRLTIGLDRNAPVHILMAE